MLNKTATGPLMFVKITPEEVKAAKEVKVGFKGAVKLLDIAFSTLKYFVDWLLDTHPSQEDLKNKYLGRCLRNRRSIEKSFNAFLEPTKIILNELEKITDPNIERVRNVIVAEINEMSEGINRLLGLLREPQQKDFSKSVEEIFNQAEKRKLNIDEAIEQQLFGHIDQNILGKLKISSFEIKKRTRLLKFM